MTKKEVAFFLDHAVLKPELTREEAINAIQLGVEYGVKTVCVRPCDVSLAVDLCKNSVTEVSCVLAFPHGCVNTKTKVEEAKLYVSQGVNEIDMVANYGYIKSGLWTEVYEDIKAVVSIAKNSNVLLKVIFETSVLTIDEIKKTTQICIDAGADYVKTSTGFYGEGATEEKIGAMLLVAGDKIKVKPSGGIRIYDDAVKYINMGCQRLGVNFTSTPVICGDKKAKATNEGY